MQSEILTKKSDGILTFIVKTLIVCTGLTFSIAALMPEMPRIPETPRNKLILLSFIQNPYVLWELSNEQEEKGNIKTALTYIQAAIGLLEMNGASKEVLKRYENRLNYLKSKLS